MKCRFLAIALLFFTTTFGQNAWIRINQLGYANQSVKVAVWCSKDSATVKSFVLVDAVTKKTVFKGNASHSFGIYGPFRQTCRFNFSSFHKPGKYYLQSGNTVSPVFEIGDNVYDGIADFCLRYMRQQRTGFNPYLKDSCHTGDGYSLYGQSAGVPDSTYFDVVGGWHDASDYLQYSTTSANATYQMLLAYRDFPQVFSDEHLANGLDGKNSLPDILDEANWGLQWLSKMFPRPNIMFNQIADDRDHISMRMPGQDTQYGRSNQRPVYFINGEPQQRGKFMNQTTGTSSTAAKFSAAFALAKILRLDEDGKLEYDKKAKDALAYANKKLGVTQTVSVRSPYIYAEENWADDMELAYANAYAMEKGSEKNKFLSEAVRYGEMEKITPWLGSDTAKHYQWYPFVNLGHKALMDYSKDAPPGDIASLHYNMGIQKVWAKARQNAFYRGVPFIWCSNNLTVAFAQQCYWYRKHTGDKQFAELEQANIDWLFGCNPWGTSMVYGMPANGDAPADPHSAFTHIKNYPIDGGLVDGPVYTSIFKGLIGIQLHEQDEYMPFQSDLAVYHDDYGDYSTNEPTMDGTASLVYLAAALQAEANNGGKRFLKKQGAIIRGDSSNKKIALIFSAHDFGEGGRFLRDVLKAEHINASFFFTGDFYRNSTYKSLIQGLKADGHFMGAHSDKHLLYAPWEKRSSLLVTKDSFITDLQRNYEAMRKHGILKDKANYFLPPYEWYNDSIAVWAKDFGLQLINFTPGTSSNADYTWPELKNYKGNAAMKSMIFNYEKEMPGGLNGFMLLMHIGTDPRRKEKFYTELPNLIKVLKAKGYSFVRVDELLR